MRLQVALLFLVYTEGKKKNKVADNDAFIPSLDVMPAPYPSAVPFGHIFKDGIGDVSPDQKQPIDMLELDLHTPTRAKQDKYMKTAPKTNLLKVVDQPVGYTNPRDEYHRFNIFDSEENNPVEVTSTTGKTDDRPAWFHFEAILEQNVKTPRPPVALQVQKPATDIKSNNVSKTESEDTDAAKAKYFSSDAFHLNKDPDVRAIHDHWTTCDQFEKKLSTFLPKDIVDIDWVPFYTWTTRSFVVSIVHRFSIPTKKTVKEYKETYGPYLNVTVDWESPKILLKEEVEMLLVAVDRNGMFQGIPRIKMPFNAKYRESIRLPVFTLRLKIVDPYLALMYCEDYYAVIMAASGSELSTDEEKTEEAAVLNFKGIGFPISRNFQFEEQAKKLEAEAQQESEETKYIKALDTGFEIERE